MSNNRQATKEQSTLSVKVLSDSHNLKVLNDFFKLIRKCYGPFSSNIVLQNELGGVVIATSSCQQLLRALPIDSPLLRLITTAVQGHSNNYTDAGMFTALLTLSLIQSSINLDVHRHLLTNVYELLLEESLCYISDIKCPAKFRLSFDTTVELVKLSSSIIASKPGSLLNKEEVQQLSRLVLIAFISGIGEKDVPDMHTILIEGKQPMMSEVCDGFLYAAPEIWNDEISTIKCTMFEHGHIRTVLMGSSMAGDSNAFVDATYELHGHFSKESAVLNQLRRWIDSVISLKVGIVFCQKVIHPKLKEILESHDVITMERLGSRGAALVARLTDGPLILSADTALSVQQCGKATSVRHCIIHDRSYLHVCGSGFVSTLILCHYSEEALDELKVSCDQSYHVLRQSLSEPWALAGGGCWLTQLAAYLKHKAHGLFPDWSAKLQCTRTQLPSIVQVFISSLYRVASSLRDDRMHYVDKGYHHHWMLVDNEPTEAVHCVCGSIRWRSEIQLVPFEEFVQTDSINLIDEMNGLAIQKDQAEKAAKEFTINEEVQENKKPDILDGLTAFKHGFQTAVFTANMVLGLSKIITDCN